MFPCYNSHTECQSVDQEPMEGLRHLVIGAAQCYLGLHEEAVASFRTCLAKRGELELCNAGERGTTGQSSDHISAFALYELGTLLCKNATVSEALLNIICSFVCLLL
jgi:hypothetical protein